MGDNIHSRAVIRKYLETYKELQLITPWPSVFWDLPIECVRPRTTLRTQNKNAMREATSYRPIRSASHKTRIWYDHNQIKQAGGFMQAMCVNSGLQESGDFNLPVPLPWMDSALHAISTAWKLKPLPLMVYRPLVERTEWIGCRQRNPDAAAYVELAREAAKHHFVVSVADLHQSVEWESSEPLDADLRFHAGELDFKTLAGLVSLSDMVFCAPGFMLVLAQALRAKMVAVFGGHESARLYDHGFAENLFIQPINPCECFDKSHRCDKTIDIPTATNQLRSFICAS